MSKSYVSLEQKMCLVTGKPFDTNSLLLDKRLKDSLEKNTVTGWGISPEVREKIDAGFIALVEIDQEKTIIKNNKILPENAYRTGVIAYLKKEVFFDIVPDAPEHLEFIFVAEDFIPGLRKLVREEEKSEETVNLKSEDEETPITLEGNNVENENTADPDEGTDPTEEN